MKQIPVYISGKCRVTLLPGSKPPQLWCNTHHAYVRKCAVCGEQFHAQRRDHWACSDLCRVNRARAKKTSK